MSLAQVGLDRLKAKQKEKHSTKTQSVRELVGHERFVCICVNPWHGIHRIKAWPCPAS